MGSLAQSQSSGGDSFTVYTTQDGCRELRRPFYWSQDVFPPAMADQSASSASVPGLPVTDLQYNVARTYVGVVSTLFALSTLILALRIASRWKTNRRLEADDYLIVGAGVSGSPPPSPSQVLSWKPLTPLTRCCSSSASLTWPP